MEQRCRVFGVNNAYQAARWLDVFEACNPAWWSTYGEDVLRIPAHKWTWDKAIADSYGINYIPGKWEDGLSRDPSYIHYGASSGYQILNIAYLYGCTRILLLGYDMKFPDAYDGHKRHAGGKRHYFGEYPEHLQHWPRMNIGPKGELLGLIRRYNKIVPQDYGIEIINCTPGSALTCFPMEPIQQCL